MSAEVVFVSSRLALVAEGASPMNRPASNPVWSEGVDTAPTRLVFCDGPPMAPTPTPAVAVAFALTWLDGRPVPRRFAPIDVAAPAPKPTPTPELTVDFVEESLLAVEDTPVAFPALFAPPSDTDADAPLLGLVLFDAEDAEEVVLLLVDEDVLEVVDPRPLRSDGLSMPPRPE